MEFEFYLHPDSIAADNREQVVAVLLRDYRFVLGEMPGTPALRWVSDAQARYAVDGAGRTDPSITDDPDGTVLIHRFNDLREEDMPVWARGARVVWARTGELVSVTAP